VSKAEANGEKTVIAKDLKGAEGIALSPDGKLIVAEVGAKRIIQVDPVNGTIAEIAANLPIGLPAAPGGLPSNIPTGVGALEPPGDLFLVGCGERDLQGGEEVGAASRAPPCRTSRYLKDRSNKTSATR
jgi:sugar lactone lactonase YvrE